VAWVQTKKGMEIKAKAKTLGKPNLIELLNVEMQDAQGYVARCTTLSTSSFCLVVWSARLNTLEH
jgi:hypothetical protein